MAVGFAVTLLILTGAGAGAQELALNPNVGPVGPLAFGGDCAGGEIYDDGSAENGYSGNPALVASFEGVQQFTPAAFPGTYDTVCVALVSLAGPNLDFEIEVRDDDGAGGTPGTLLGALPVSAAGIPAGLPCAFYQYDITSLMLNIPSGNVFIGVRWNPMLFPSRFVCSDESPATPLHPGYVNFNLGNGWQATQTVFPAYRAKLIRAIPGTVGPTDADLTITKSGIVNLDQIVYTITVTNNGPADATNVVVTDTLPAEVTYVSDDCGGSNVPPWTWNIGGLLNGANATCNVTVNVDPLFEGTVSNTASVTADQPDPTPGNETSTVDLFVEGPVTNPLEIPTLGTIGFAVLALLLVAGALYLIRRRATTA
jgi:uncharacterized repeat protein (TIGR01451 family)